MKIQKIPNKIVPWPLLILLFLIFLLILALIFASWNLGQDKIDQTNNNTYQANEPEPNGNSTSIEELGFALSLPKEYEIKKYSDKKFIIGKNKESDFLPEIELTFFSSTEARQEFINNELSKSCQITTAGLIIDCPETRSTEEFSNQNGINGLEVYFIQKTAAILDDIVETEDKGPFYVIPTEDTGYLVIYPPINLTAAQSNYELINKVINSLKKL